MLRNISLHEKTKKIEVQENELEFKLLQTLFPSRRNWIELNQSERKSCNNSIKINQLRLFKTYIKTKENIKNGLVPPQWYVNLLNYVNEIRDEVINIESSNYKIASPEVRGIKKGVKDGVLVCRPIALYRIKDKIISSLTAKYLTIYFENIFLDCSYAFRPRNSLNEIPTHHDCIEKILQERKKHKEIWVAECDIQKFFDTVQHEYLLKIFNELSEKVESDFNLKMDLRAKKIFQLFLASFSFKKDVFTLNQTPEWFNKRGLANGQFDWVEKELEEKFGLNYTSTNIIGVPQGNAISCFISNLILHKVDEKVLNHQSDAFYIRYCDDMVLMHVEKEKCSETLNVYMEELNKNFLLYHPTKKIIDYKKKCNSKKFWKSKSKEPFFWGDKHQNEENIPWVSFVGYQVDFNCKIRIRKSTIKKETKKQIATTQKILKSLGKTKQSHIIKPENSRWSTNQIVSSLHQRLISMSVGRINLLNHVNPTEQGLCWTNGFKKVFENKITAKQFRYLDKRRQIQLLRLRIELGGLKKKVKKNQQGKKKTLNEKGFTGGAHSYHNFLKYK